MYNGGHLTKERGVVMQRNVGTPLVIAVLVVVIAIIGFVFKRVTSVSEPPAPPPGKLTPGAPPGRDAGKPGGTNPGGLTPGRVPGGLPRG